MATRVRYAATAAGNITASGADTSPTPLSLAGGNIAVIGNLIIVIYESQNDNRVPTSVADTAGTTYTAIGSAQQGGAGYVHAWWGVVAANTAGQNIIITLSGAQGDKTRVGAWEVSGLSTSQAGLTTSSAASENTAAHGSAAVTPANATGFLIAISSRTNGDYTEDGDFTEESDGDGNLYIGYIANPPASAQTFSFASDGNEFSVNKVFALEGAGGTPPAITDVDTDESITATQTNVVITGTGFDTATVDIEQGATVKAQSIDSQSATSIQFDVVFDAGADDLKYGAATLRVTNGDTQDATQAITITAPTGVAYIDLASIETEGDNRITAAGDLEIGDQIEISNVQGGVVADITLQSDGTFIAAENVTAFDARAWDHNDSAWGSIGTQTLVDAVPDAFAFTDQTGVTPSSVRTSNTITVVGLGTDVSADVTITGGTYSKNGAGYTSSAGTAVNGDTFAVRHTASGSYSTAVNTALTIGGVSDTFTSTTMANAQPTFIGPDISDLTFTIDVAISPRDYSGRFSDLDALTFTMVGSLPTGLSLSSAGVLTGTPTVEESVSSLEIRASDGSLTRDSNSFSITIEAAAVAGGRPTISGDAINDGTGESIGAGVSRGSGVSGG